MNAVRCWQGKKVALTGAQRQRAYMALKSVKVPVDERVHEGQQVRNMVKIKIKFVPLSGPISSVNSMMIIVMHQNDEADVGRERGLEVLPLGRAQCVQRKRL